MRRFYRMYLPRQSLSRFVVKFASLEEQPRTDAMSYVSKVLQPGEVVRYQTAIHWKVYAPGLALLLAGLIWFVVSPREWKGSIFIEGIVSVMIIAAIVMLFAAWFERWTTEIAVTDRRIIYKRGFIRRYTIEMNMDKVESIDVDQSIAGRLLNFGDIIIRGTGASLEPLRNIECPLEFRNHVTAA